MRLSPWLPLAVLSACAICGAATRPRYGGTLRVEMRATGLDATPLASLAFETLVRLDASGAPQPCLATGWQHDAAAKRWQFNLRPGVRFHDGSPLTAAAVISALQMALPGMVVAAAGDAVAIRADHPVPDLLLVLARDGPIVTRDADGHLAGTGPFRLTAFEPGRRATFAGNEDYWGGRPFLDSVDIQLGRGQRDQLTDLELARTDVAELAPADARRASAHSRTVWSSAAVNLIALKFAQGRAEDVRLREALALSIDRAAMLNVLLQKQGEASAALLPQWLSGYAFAFPAAPDLARARSLAGALPAAARAVSLTYDAAVPAARALADRVAVNARDSGLVVQVSAQNPHADVRLVIVRLPSLSPQRALAGVAAALGLETAPPAPGLAALFESERKLLDGFRVIPLFHLPDLYGVSGRVRVYAPPPIAPAGDLHFDNVWLTGNAP